MSLEVGIIVFLCFFIVFFLGRHKQQLRKQKNQLLNEKILQALSAYPVYQYTMAHMLERCLAIIFSAPQISLLPQGAIFLSQKDTLNLISHRGHENFQVKHYHDFFADRLQADKILIVERNDLINRVRCIQSLDYPQFSPLGHYVVPIMSRGSLIGVLTLSSKKDCGKCDDEDIEFIVSIGRALSCLIERKLYADELRLGNNVINLSQQAIFISDKNNQIIRCNDACEKMTGYFNDELIGQAHDVLHSNYHSSGFYIKMWNSAREHGFWQGEVWNKTKRGDVFVQWLTISVVRDADDNVEQYIVVFSDLTATKNAEKDIQSLSFFDSLTQLPNRVLFIDRVRQAIVQASRKENQFAVLCLDIDHFKKVNETFGHEAGDKLLQFLANRLANMLAKEGSLARIGGDEFAIIIHDLSSKDNYKLAHLAENILLNFKQSVPLEGQDYIATCSIGISLFPVDADNTNDLIKYADSVMFQSKKIGRNSYQFHSKKLNQNAQNNINYEFAMRSALKEEGFSIFFQPQFELNSHSIVGAEALLRVNQGMLSKVLPAEYIPIAEESELIFEIGDWVFMEVCKLLKSWCDEQLLPASFKRVAINISPIQFKHPEFIKKIQQCIEKTDVPVKYLEIELTEGSLKESISSVNDKLLAIQSMGINIAIDDFGTGYSSLSRLKQFPINLVKIDRSFVNDICINQRDIAIAEAIINMANALGIDILAEGIETVAQEDMLKSLNCHVGQGFSLCKPLNVSGFKGFLLSSNTGQKPFFKSIH